jgi:hypothetical protein
MSFAPSEKPVHSMIDPTREGDQGSVACIGHWPRGELPGDPRRDKLNP